MTQLEQTIVDHASRFYNLPFTLSGSKAEVPISALLGGMLTGGKFAPAQKRSPMLVEASKAPLVTSAQAHTELELAQEILKVLAGKDPMSIQEIQVAVGVENRAELKAALVHLRQNNGPVHTRGLGPATRYFLVMSEDFSGPSDEIGLLSSKVSVSSEQGGADEAGLVTPKPSLRARILHTLMHSGVRGLTRAEIAKLCAPASHLTSLLRQLLKKELIVEVEAGLPKGQKTYRYRHLTPSAIQETLHIYLQPFGRQGLSVKQICANTGLTLSEGVVDRVAHVGFRTKFGSRFVFSNSAIQN